jgi:hypothetical protein
LRLHEINAELKQFPDPPPNALSVVNKALADFNRRFCAMIESQEPSDFTRTWKGLRKSFAEDITTSQRPTLIVVDTPAKISTVKSKTTSTPTKRETADTVVLHESDSDSVPTPSKKRKVSSARVPLPRSLAPQSADRTPLHKIFRLDEVRSILDEFSASGLPDAVELKAVENLIMLTLVNWDRPLRQLLVGLRNALVTAIYKILDETVAEWKSTALVKEMLRVIGIFFSVHVGDLESNIASRALRIERTKPITNNTQAMNRVQEEELQVFQNARFRARSDAFFDEQDKVTGKATSAEERDRKRRTNEADIKSKLGSDPFKRELQVMAQIRAYYTIASARFVDTIFQAVEAELFVKLKGGLLDELEEGLHVTHTGSQEYAGKLLDDDPARAERRMVLKKQKEGLCKAAERLKQLEV